jgi:membrane protease YdiL (CAAX protease family)
LGALPLNVFNFLQVFTASCILGLIYVRTRSMMLVVSLHGLYDAIWSLTPVLREPLAWHWGAGVLLLALFVTWLWARREPWPNLRLDADAEPVARP